MKARRALMIRRLGRDLRPKQRVKLFAEDDTCITARGTHADFGPKGRIKGRFESGAPRNSGPTVGVKCAID